MFDESNHFLHFLSNNITQSICNGKWMLHNPPRQQLGAVPPAVLPLDSSQPPFSHHIISIYSSHICTCTSHMSHLDVSGIDIFPSPTDKKKEWQLKIIWGLSPYLWTCLSNGKTTKNDADYFSNKHICINYMPVTNGHAISIFRGKCNVSPMIILNILGFPSIYLDRLFKLWHNN